MRASYAALCFACIALVVVIAACASGAPVAPASGALTPSPTAASLLKTPAATASLAPAPDIPAEEAGQTLCFSCHGPGELPTIPDHSVMQDGRAGCEQCHRQAK